MTELIAVFRSRSQAIDCNMRLRTLGIPSNVISTPREANVGCGLSVKIPKGTEVRARAVISNFRYSAFYGYYTVKIY